MTVEYVRSEEKARAGKITRLSAQACLKGTGYPNPNDAQPPTETLWKPS